MSGVVSVVIRFICHIPAGIAGIGALGLYNSAKGLGDIFDVIPNGHRFLHGLQIAGQGVSES